MGNSSTKPKRGPKLEITEVDRAVLSLKSQRRRLEGHRTRVISQIDREHDVARQLVAAGRKDRALLALKKKRLQETSLEKLDAWLLNVEYMLADVELSKDRVRVMAALQQGNEAQKQLQSAVSLEDVERLMEETAEAREYQEQLQLALGAGSWSGEDEEAAEAEMAELEKELAAKKAPGKEVVVEKEEELPSAPTHVPVMVMPAAAARRLQQQVPEEGLVPAS